jgi:hypothetical protein
MRHRVDPEPRRVALANAAIEQIDASGNFRKQGRALHRDLEPCHFRVAQINDNAGAVGSLDPGFPQGVTQTNRARFAGQIVRDALFRHGLKPRVRSLCFDPLNLSVTLFPRKGSGPFGSCATALSVSQNENGPVPERSRAVNQTARM